MDGRREIGRHGGLAGTCGLRLLAERPVYAHFVPCKACGSRPPEKSVIVYSLSCAKGHEFEGWFRDSTAFDEQSKTGKLVCPSCNSRKVSKAMMAPSVSGTKKKAEPTVGQLRDVSS